ncbi:hypothetical protein ACV35V_33645, partial [Pseudomonas aeruginosa]
LAVRRQPNFSSMFNAGGLKRCRRGPSGFPAPFNCSLSQLHSTAGICWLHTSTTLHTPIMLNLPSAMTGSQLSFSSLPKTSIQD